MIFWRLWVVLDTKQIHPRRNTVHRLELELDSFRYNIPPSVVNNHHQTTEQWTGRWIPTRKTSLRTITRTSTPQRLLP